VVKRRRTLTLKSLWESGSFVTPCLPLVSCPNGGANYSVRRSMLAGVRRVPIIRSVSTAASALPAFAPQVAFDCIYPNSNPTGFVQQLHSDQ